MLRDYQQKAIGDIKTEFEHGKQSVCLTMPTGAGKTLTCAHMLKSCVERGMRAWFLVHRRELVKQSISAFDACGVDHGVISAGFLPNANKRVQIASVQTLSRRWQSYASPDMIVIDECHHVAAKNWSALMSNFPSSYKIGLTATPMRLDGAGLGNHFDSMVTGPKISWLIENGFLSPYKIYAPSTIDTSGFKKRMGDFSTADISSAVDKPKITGCAVEHYKKLCAGKRAVVFSSSVEHSKHVVSEFIAEGIPAAHVDGDTDNQIRDMIIDRFSRGEILVLSNVELFGEGFDLPSMEAVILLRPTMSLSLYMQQVGRCLRYVPGKTAVILDHAGNCARHGMPCDDREFSLTLDKIRESKNVIQNSVKICPKCFAAQMSGSSRCMYCRCEFPVDARKIETVSGELVEITQQKISLENRRSQGQCKTLDDLVIEGKRRGMKNPAAWAYHVHQARLKKRG